jgi:hypothetical protein
MLKVLSDIFKTKDNLKKITTNHVFVVDVSGSMYSSLPKMREHIKNNFALLVKPKDTVSIIYFSSRGQYGVVFENQEIGSIADLSALQKSVDRFLKPMGLTGFLEPIKEAVNVVKRIDNGNINNFIFMTDGYDNQWGESEILKQCETLPEVFHNIVFIEYGFYCNRKLIEKMASISSGFHVFSEDYSEYETQVEQILTSNMSNNIVVETEGEFAFYFDGGDMYTKEIKDGKVSVPEDLSSLYVIENLDVNESTYRSLSDDVKYGMLYIAISKMKSNEAWKMLRNLGDVNIIEQFTNCFSKQDYSTILKNIKEAIFDESKRYVKGVNFSLVPKDDAFTVIDLVNILASDDNKLMVADDAFSYNKIGANTKETSKEDKLKALQEKLSKTTDPDEIKEIAEEIVAVRENVKFVPHNLSDGVEIGNVVYNESRPNISINTTLFGYAEIDADIATKCGMPKQFPTSISRSYTLVKDGIKNIHTLPVRLTLGTFAQLQSNGLLEGETYMIGETYYIDLTKIPLINRNMVKEVKAKEYFEKSFQLEKMKALQKVFKFKLDEMTPKGAKADFIEAYGEEGAKYLESVGIRPYGFNPKVSTDKIGDFYYSKELNIKISGLSSLPAVGATITKKTSGKKINLADQLILDALDAYDTEIALLSNPSDKEVIKVHIEKRTKEIISDVRTLQNALNKAMYAIIVGQVWFEGFDDVDNTSMDFNYNGIAYTVKAVLEEKEIKI